MTPKRKPVDPIQRAREERGGETMIHVAYSRWRPGLDATDDGHLIRRGSVICDLGLETDAGQDFTNDEMQLIARAAKFAAIDCIRARNGARIKRRTEALPRAVRELLRDVVLIHEDSDLASISTPGAAGWTVLGRAASRAARILGTTPGEIVAKRKARK